MLLEKHSLIISVAVLNKANFRVNVFLSIFTYGLCIFTNVLVVKNTCYTAVLSEGLAF